MDYLVEKRKKYIITILFCLALLGITGKGINELGHNRSQYKLFLKYMDEKDYYNAYSAAYNMRGFRPDLVDTDKNLQAAKTLYFIKEVGWVYFGTYPYNNTEKRHIDWIVLETQDNRALLISRHALDCMPYNAEYEDTSWEKSTLRAWLNTEFLNEAFSAEEQKHILTTEVDNSLSQGNSEYDTSGGENTMDKIFLLSYAEACKYFSDDESRMCAPRDYAINKGGRISNSSMIYGRYTGLWWLRSPGYKKKYASYVFYNGTIRDTTVTATNIVVRPAFWINTESASWFNANRGE